MFTFTTLLHVKPQDLEKAADNIKKIGKYGIFIEPVIKGDRNKITSRVLHQEIIRDQIQKGYILQGIESSFCHNYRQYFNVINSKKIGSREIFFIKLYED